MFYFVFSRKLILLFAKSVKKNSQKSKYYKIFAKIVSVQLYYIIRYIFIYIYLPTSGLSEVIGMIVWTVFRKIVSDNKTVTPEKQRRGSASHR